MIVSVNQRNFKRFLGNPWKIANFLQIIPSPLIFYSLSSFIFPVESKETKHVKDTLKTAFLDQVLNNENSLSQNEIKVFGNGGTRNKNVKDKCPKTFNDSLYRDQRASFKWNFDRRKIQWFIFYKKLNSHHFEKTLLNIFI